MPDRQRQSLNEAKHVECDNDSGLKEVENNSIKSNNYINESVDDTNSNIHIEERNTFQPDDWITVRKKKHGNDIQLRNRFTSLNYKCVERDDIKNDVIDLYDGDNELRNTHLQPTTHTDKPKSNVYLNNFPERDVQHYNKRTVPGNSFKNDVIKHGKTVCVPSDSICKRIKINEFNKILNNKKAYKRCFEGADTKALQHYATPTLTNNKPDIVIINVGSNNMRRDKPVCIADDIIGIASQCKTYGVNQVLISGLTPQIGSQTKIDELNSILESRQEEWKYSFLQNQNILASEHLWRDKVHLNDAGLALLANNFLNDGPS